MSSFGSSLTGVVDGAVNGVISVGKDVWDLATGVADGVGSYVNAGLDAIAAGINIISQAVGDGVDYLQKNIKVVTTNQIVEQAQQQQAQQNANNSQAGGNFSLNPFDAKLDIESVNWRRNLYGKEFDEQWQSYEAESRDQNIRIQKIIDDNIQREVNRRLLIGYIANREEG